MAVRIANVTIPNDKRVEIALTYVYGIGRTTANIVMNKAGIGLAVRVKDLTEEEVNKLREAIEKNFKVEGDLRREVVGNIKRLKEIHSFRGSRHAKNLPARGQRTKTNSRTVRGNKRSTATSGRKDSGQKT